MTSHELANLLLASPNLPVMINGWGSDEGVTCEVSNIRIVPDSDGADKEIHLDY
jgi:hypothetical protein